MIEAFHKEFTVKRVTNDIMLGVTIKSGTDENGIRWTELTQTDYIEDMYAAADRVAPMPAAS